ncbi:uncharacterized protein MYCFIDRAFT_173481 [Pseudocercospora fijiensis CIRAD86]|uniref:Uncharacterized protein n=1 Tax=Pseudocercospora fijiensis (strain CIRAD86) TaxID=383855 RepID=M3B568_PSEFD|nr:uncharacterized protein MYCFIDRAFT_173481 [Pseudocercospora fijiensis CIRAD86]EME84502.1 hypothetical protein MYCFIDRAFT_173481 [Pseudocercospora fijiensis CIRAD86]
MYDENMRRFEHLNYSMTHLGASGLHTTQYIIIGGGTLDLRWTLDPSHGVLSGISQTSLIALYSDHDTGLHTRTLARISKGALGIHFIRGRLLSAMLHTKDRYAAGIPGGGKLKRPLTSQRMLLTLGWIHRVFVCLAATSLLDVLGIQHGWRVRHARLLLDMKSAGMQLPTIMAYSQKERSE